MKIEIEVFEAKLVFKMLNVTSQLFSKQSRIRTEVF